ncbi:hypothetical protein [Clostridium septicum]|uniref:hypothetical protein n=1 Tax=Clostridium septicum TaxID=1504 RepID=UPI000FF8DB4C|nr:hypothetical protein [Clostridium septicum]QAS59378.1 hypothetical protein EI377_00245 [Clostridium septicum]
MGYLPEIANKIKNGERVERIVDSIRGTKGAAEAKTTIRLLDEVVDANFLNIINKYKNKLPQWAIGKGNFGCAEVTIEGITKMNILHIVQYRQR